jgi:hypothetical protein
METSSTLSVESQLILVGFQWTTHRYIPEDRTPQREVPVLYQDTVGYLVNITSYNS